LLLLSLLLLLLLSLLLLLLLLSLAGGGPLGGALNPPLGGGLPPPLCLGLLSIIGFSPALFPAGLATQQCTNETSFPAGMGSTVHPW